MSKKDLTEMTIDELDDYRHQLWKMSDGVKLNIDFVVDKDAPNGYLSLMDGELELRTSTNRAGGVENTLAQYKGRVVFCTKEKIFLKGKWVDVVYDRRCAIEKAARVDLANKLKPIEE